jgi:2-polyprenyl-6-methoxyphenol hydroxylase-like FAD-dependent oxidoreductase
MKGMQMRVGIAGGGIGGLTLALMLRERGVDCEVWEAATEIKPLGVGINLLPHATREMCELGLEARLADIAIETSSLSYYNMHGQRIWHEPRGRAAGYAWPQFSIHRGEFQVLLAEVVGERYGQGFIQTGLRAERFENAGDQVIVHLRGRDGQAVERRVDVLIASDGIHSAIRKQMVPSGDELQFSGRMLWRAVSEAEPYLDGRSMFMSGHPDQKFVAYPISEPYRRRSRSLINWIAELRVSPEAMHNDWNREVPKSLFNHAFADWNWGWVDIPGLIRDAKAVFEFPMVDKNPLRRWVDAPGHRVALLGDAAHPMYPIGSNGSAQAILDARCLADALKNASSPQQALLEYEAERLPKTAGIVLRNRLNGPEYVMQLAHERAPQGFKTDVNEVIPQAELEEIAARYKRLAGFDPQSLNANR